MLKVKRSRYLGLEDLEANGFRQLEAITAATQTITAVLQLDDLGTIAEAKSADFMVLDANPFKARCSRVRTLA